MTSATTPGPTKSSAANVACVVENARSMSGAATLDTPLASSSKSASARRTEVTGSSRPRAAATRGQIRSVNRFAMVIILPAAPARCSPEKGSDPFFAAARKWGRTPLSGGADGLLALGAAQREHGALGVGALAEPARDAREADAGSDVELRRRVALADLVEAAAKLEADLSHDPIGDPLHVHLAAVGVARQHDVRTARGDRGRAIWCVAQHDARDPGRRTGKGGVEIV